MRISFLVASLLGTALMAGGSGACLAGDAAQTVDIGPILQDEAAAPGEARADLNSAVDSETRANKELEAAVSVRDSAQIALANAQERLDEIQATLDAMPRHDPARTGLTHEAAALGQTIDRELFTRLDDAKDRVTNARQDLRAAQRVKQAAVEQVRLTSAPGDRLTYNAEYDFAAPASRHRAYE